MKAAEQERNKAEQKAMNKIRQSKYIKSFN